MMKDDSRVIQCKRCGNTKSAGSGLLVRRVVYGRWGRRKMKCRLCGKSALEISGFLVRVNETGVTGIWECRPTCDAWLSPDEAVIAAIEWPDESHATENNNE